MTSIKHHKKQLREQMKQTLSKLAPSDKQQESEQIVTKIAQFVRTSPEIKTIASYAAMPDEVNLDGLHSALPEINFCYPLCGKNGQMNFYSVSALSEMQTSRHGIREPSEHHHDLISPEAIDLFLCPAYAYSPTGERLGKGGGYYDRYLLKKRSEVMTLGIVFSCQIVNLTEIPIESHDLIIDRIL